MDTDDSIILHLQYEEELDQWGVWIMDSDGSAGDLIGTGSTKAKALLEAATAMADLENAAPTVKCSECDRVQCECANIQWAVENTRTEHPECESKEMQRARAKHAREISGK